jgi:hypothetical protein
VNELFVSLGDKALESYKKFYMSPVKLLLPLAHGFAFMNSLALVCPVELQSQPSSSPSESSRKLRYAYIQLLPVITTLASLFEMYYIWLIFGVWPTQDLVERFVFFGSLMTIIKYVGLCLSLLFFIFKLLQLTWKILFLKRTKTTKTQ